VAIPEDFHVKAHTPLATIGSSVGGGLMSATQDLGTGATEFGRLAGHISAGQAAL
jgi:hypothetical protein